MKKSILVTGATGFIGRNLVRELLTEGKSKIYCLIRNFNKAKYLFGSGAKLIYGDISDFNSLSKISKLKIDIIIIALGLWRIEEGAFFTRQMLWGQIIFAGLRRS